MKKTIFLTSSIHTAETVAAAGIDAYPVLLPLTEEKIRALKILSPGLIISEYEPALVAFISSLQGDSRVVFFGEEALPSDSHLLKDHGIAEYFHAPDTVAIIDYIRETTGELPLKPGIVVFEPDQATARFMKGLCVLLGYDPVISSSTDDFIKNVNQRDNEMALINITASALDMHKIVCESFASTNLTRIPVIAYGAIDQGIMISTLLGGLNRVTKVVLSLDELWAFLADILFRNSYYPLLKRSIRYSGHHEVAYNAGDTLRSYYWNNEQTLFNDSGVLNGENIAVLAETSSRLRNILVRSSGIRWVRGKEAAAVIVEGRDSVSRHPFSFR